MFEHDEPDYEFSADVPGERLDKLLADMLDDLSRTRLQALIKEGRVRVDGAVVKPSYKVEGGETLTIFLPPPETSAVIPQDIPLDVIYEDDDLIAINKPAGMVVHPAYGHDTGTLVNAVLFRWPQLAEVGDEHRAGIVHRLDKDTSGVILVTKTPQAHRAIAAQFEQRQTEKHYLALVEGHPDSSTGRIEAPIGRDPRQRKRMAVVRGGREAISEFKVLEYYDEFALLDVQIFTGPDSRAPGLHQPPDRGGHDLRLPQAADQAQAQFPARPPDHDHVAQHGRAPDDHRPAPGRAPKRPGQATALRGRRSA